MENTLYSDVEILRQAIINLFHEIEKSIKALLRDIEKLINHGNSKIIKNKKSTH